jgi:hypothetical protein
MPQETKSMPTPAIEPAQTLPGWTVDLTDPALTMQVLEKAFDYRGDVTLTLADGRAVTGYLFDRQRGADLVSSSVRLMVPTPGPDEKLTVRYADLRRVAFSDRDPAAGKSFETWVKKYTEKKLAGERASIESDPLDD